MKNTIRSILFLILGLSLSVPAQAKDPIKIGYSDWPGWVAWEIAKEKELFKKQGVDVDLVWFADYTESLKAIVAGKLDANCMAWSDVIQPLSEGVKLKVVLVNDNSAGNDAILAKPGINSIKELKGKSIATELGTVEHFIMLTALAKNGMGENSVEYKNMTIADSAAAFLAGKLDAVALWQPWISQIEREGKGKVLFSSKEMPGLVPDQLAVRETIVNERADEIQKIVAVWFEVVDFIKTHEDDAVKIMAKVVAQKPEDYKAFLPGTRFFDLEANLEAFQPAGNDKSLTGSGKKIAAFLQAKGLIKTVPDLASALEPKFVKALKK
jgi:NitT/TauT family transport system substrate-binding protein